MSTLIGDIAEETARLAAALAANQRLLEIARLVPASLDNGSAVLTTEDLLGTDARLSLSIGDPDWKAWPERLLGILPPVGGLRRFHRQSVLRFQPEASYGPSHRTALRNGLATDSAIVPWWLHLEGAPQAPRLTLSWYTRLAAALVQVEVLLLAATRGAQPEVLVERVERRDSLGRRDDDVDWTPSIAWSVGTVDRWHVRNIARQAPPLSFTWPDPGTFHDARPAAADIHRWWAERWTPEGEE